MGTEMGEYLVGAYLEIIKKCDVVSYNVRFPGEGIKAMRELDVMGLNFKTNTAFLCEVATHILGMLYSGKTGDSIAKVRKKFKNQKKFAKKQLGNFKNIHFQFWAPKVITSRAKELYKIRGLESVINQDYTTKVNQLRAEAKQITKVVNNPAFRMLQILEHMRKEM